MRVCAYSNAIQSPILVRPKMLWYEFVSSILLLLNILGIRVEKLSASNIQDFGKKALVLMIWSQAPYM
jgi:competence protein ComGC